MTVLVAAAAVAAPAPAAAPLAFTPADMLGWERERFQGETRYALEGEALRAACRDSASGLVLRRRIDLRTTPVLEWSWRVDAVFDPAGDETVKAGDDFPARVYVVQDGGAALWRTRAISYVWASGAAPGSDWPNPFARQARMVVLRSGPTSPPGTWQHERRDVAADFLAYFGSEVDAIDGVAIMTDCDNRAAAVEAWYGPLRFVGREGKGEGR